jgi:hypothetical protein
MTVHRFLQNGEAEMFKGAIHAAVGVLAMVCGAYNIAAWTTRRERHLGLNAILYTGIALWEVGHVRHHGQCAAAARGQSGAIIQEGERTQAAFVA